VNGSLNLHPKVAATLLATWVVVLIVYALNQWAHVVLPTTASAALTGIIAFAAGWLAPGQVQSSTSVAIDGVAATKAPS
jgi:hypothetical protein